jgi:uncharacterized protein (TIGR00297 family)
LDYIFLAIFLFVGVVESIRHRKLTRPGAVAGGIIGFCVFIAAGWTGIAMLGSFFLLGTLATSWKRRQKGRAGLAQERGGRRNLGQVVANGGVAGLLGATALFLPQQKELLASLIAGALSAAIADTLSSELGTVYGTRFYNIITMRSDKKGLDGVVSLEGTLIGIAGSAIVAGIYCTGFGWGSRFFWIIFAGTLGNVADSVLGATLERKGVIGNDAVNFFNTLAGALALWLFG